MLGRERLGQKVFEQMGERLVLSDYEGVFFHTGKNYRDYLIPKLEKLALKCEVPLGNLPIGKQLAWYKTHNC